MAAIPYGRQDVTQEDVDLVASVLTSDYLTQGPWIPKFEKALAKASGAAHAVAVNSATSALHIACMALGLGPGDSLWTSPNTFVASANCALYCGADVDFVDIDPKSYNMSVAALEAKLATAQTAGTLPKIVVPVHFAGQSCDMEAIHRLSKAYGFQIIEDASHAVGATYKGEPVGNCRYSDVTVFSFHPVKIITTAEGGMALTQRADLANHMQQLRTHGITREPQQMTRESEGPWYYQQVALGYNYRITDIQAALGFSQMQRLQDYVARRHVLAKRYDDMLQGLPLDCPWQSPDSHSALHLYPIVLHDAARRKAVFDAMRAEDILVNVLYIPVHRQPHYENRGFKSGDFPESERYYAGSLALPMFPALTFQDQDRVVHTLKRILAA
jgi:UDP-4-amino-4,6-dideoxy-N-acetyl-beta-L-altrosamine transaminase